MKQCDVQCSEYMHRYNTSEKTGQTLLRHGKLQDYSLTVASSLQMILPKIAEDNQTALEVLHLLSFLGPDMLTKPILRQLLNAKSNYDCLDAERQQKKERKKKNLTNRVLVCCSGVVLGSAAMILPAMTRQRAGVITLLTMTATSVLLYLREDKHSDIQSKYDIGAASMKRVTSVSEFEQCDLSWDILKAFSLLSVKEGKGNMHRLLQQAMRSCQTEEEQYIYLTLCIDAMESSWTFKNSDIETWKPSLQILDHVKSVVGHCEHVRHFDAIYLVKIAQLSRDCGVLSAMALNAFVEAETSLKLSLVILQEAYVSTNKQKLEFRKARAVSLYELSKIYRYQGRYEDANKCLMDSLGLNKTDDCLTADTLHELGILEVKKHNLDSAASYLNVRGPFSNHVESRDMFHLSSSDSTHQILIS